MLPEILPGILPPQKCGLRGALGCVSQNGGRSGFPYEKNANVGS